MCCGCCKPMSTRVRCDCGTLQTNVCTPPKSAPLHPQHNTFHHSLKHLPCVRACAENSALQTENSTRTTPADGKDGEESQQQENEIMSPARAGSEHGQKGSYSQSAGHGSGPHGAAVDADECHRDNSSKRMSSDDAHVHNKGSGVQGDQVSAQSNPSDYKGSFFNTGGALARAAAAQWGGQWVGDGAVQRHARSYAQGKRASSHL
jgi:hypothetical protein